MKKNFGIILSYPPEILSGSHGIPRLIMNIIRGAHQKDYTVLIVAPKWSERELRLLLNDTLGDNSNNIQIVTTDEIPPILHVRYNVLKIKRIFRKKVILSRFFADLQNKTEKALIRLYGSQRWISFCIGCLFTILLLPFFYIYLFNKTRSFKKESDEIPVKVHSSDYLARLSDPVKLYNSSYLTHGIYSEMLHQEIRKIVKLTKSHNQCKTVSHWLITTPFWPDLVKNIEHPTVICPDVIIRDFAVGFERDDFGKMILSRKDEIRQSLQNAEKIICFSSYVKNNQIAAFGRFDGKISVIHHGHINLSEALDVIKPFNTMREREKSDLSRQIITSYLRRNKTEDYIKYFDFSGTRFLFYSSQIRASKNIPSLINACHRLLHYQYEPIKLILTGNPNIESNLTESIVNLISDLGLQKDIIFLPDMPTQVMAAFYQQSALAVNPSLFEGGFPFTFSEAYSVRTPSILSRIPVVEEFVTDPDLQKVMLFDPYDINDMVERIQWGLHHRDELLTLEEPLYNQLKERSWAHVVEEYQDVLER